jgi:AcrR family transcriptional regulator
MSPKKVNKETKRREIALACSHLFHDVGMKKLTVAEVAKTAGIGKGTVYEYFDNKDDIVFEIMNMHIEQYHNEFLEKIKDIKSTKEKLYHFFSFVLNDDEENLKHFNGYKEYLAITLSEENESMCNFNDRCNSFFKDQMKKVIQDGIDSNELMPEAIEFSSGIHIFEKGLALMKMTNPHCNVQKEFEQFIEAFFDLVEVKNV